MSRQPIDAPDRPVDVLDDAVAEIIELRRQQAELHRREIHLLVKMRRNASSRLPDDATPGGVRPLPEQKADRWVRAAEIVACELAPALEISPLTAINMVHEADRLARLFPELLARLGDGSSLDARRLAVAQSITSELPDAAAAQVGEILARSQRVGTAAQWRSRVNRIARRVTGTDFARERRKRSVADRYLHVGKIDINGMCQISGYLPAIDAAEADAALDFMASTASAGDTRTRDQLRVDALMTALRGPTAFRRSDPNDLDLPFVDAEGVTRNVSDDEAETVAATWAAIRDLGAEVDLTIPRIPDRLVDVVVPATILAGADCIRNARETDYADAAIGHLGEIDPAYGRMLAKDARWRRIVIDPLSGAPLDIGTTRYRPPKRMRQRVQLRDDTCRFPGCARRACKKSELDHLEPHRPDGNGGSTADENLANDCKQHHRWKHQLGLDACFEPDGTLVWTIRGREYRTYNRQLI